MRPYACSRRSSRQMSVGVSWGGSSVRGTYAGGEVVGAVGDPACGGQPGKTRNDPGGLSQAFFDDSALEE